MTDINSIAYKLAMMDGMNPDGSFKGSPVNNWLNEHNRRRVREIIAYRLAMMDGMNPDGSFKGSPVNNWLNELNRRREREIIAYRLAIMDVMNPDGSSKGIQDTIKPNVGNAKPDVVKSVSNVEPAKNKAMTMLSKVKPKHLAIGAGVAALGTGAGLYLHHRKKKRQASQPTDKIAMKLAAFAMSNNN